MDWAGLENIAIFRLPYLIVYGIGIVYLANKRRWSPRPCRLGIVILSFMLAFDLISVSLNIYWYVVAGRTGKLLWLLDLQAKLFNFCHVIGLLALVYAIGLDRVRRNEQSHPAESQY
jgi:hypothetical protein